MIKINPAPPVGGRIKTRPPAQTQGCHGAQVFLQFLTIMGNPAKVLSRYADAYNVDVIVMGRVGHRGMGRLVGSTVEHLLYKMPCSVWVVSPEDL
ncbi:universal stress protein [Pseudomonas sp. PGPR40]|uniref:universal stress protein n=1 Tax=Pseudomonas sp. PGPR40 TaxID=2913476 RepID=UPI0022AA3399|nr:universal stress protein [Pseudomonas sp. PGPR40]